MRSCTGEWWREPLEREWWLRSVQIPKVSKSYVCMRSREGPHQAFL